MDGWIYGLHTVAEKAQHWKLMQIDKTRAKKDNIFIWIWKDNIDNNH